ncbi:MAG: tRNA (adenosine(37)-N6)-threonylcarbamoyltransferase complex dimerization subunit type 1 TsaB [Lachnospiraceae bacterium]|nr:tRNA (adenosine(37)-N6)-threonylcarbamoyltransferase complex dimerization subunit type 1 TsaB [Lachnospiraceae bacterium]
MKILGLDSSGLVASVAVVEDDNLLAEYTINYKKTHSQTLLPMLDEVAKMIELDLNTVDYIAVAMGPGSFTGLRIGSATAKGLGLALKKELISIPTVDGLAYNMVGSRELICPIMDARRNQVYTGLYEFCKDQMTVVKEQSPMDILEIIREINEMNRDVVFLGDGVKVYKEIIEKEIKVPYYFAPANMNKQRAASVASLGLCYAKEGKVESAAMHRPEYLRMTQAERERKERLKAQHDSENATL